MSKGKQKVGKKTCRIVQPADGSMSIIPNILRKLLKARKSTRKLIVFQTVTLDDGSELSGLYSCKEVDGVETVQETVSTFFQIEGEHEMSFDDVANLSMGGFEDFRKGSSYDWRL